MIHPHTTLRLVDAEIGYGVFAAQPIPTGTIVYIQDALEHCFPAGHPMLEHPIYGPLIERYSYRNASGVSVFSWDLARYTNHSCDANTLTTGFGFEIAVRDIAAGEEITDDYGLFNLTIDLQCRCGSPRCRGVIASDAATRLAAGWDARVRLSLDRFMKVEQPLLPVMEPAVYRRLRRYLATGAGYPSVRNQQYRQQQRVAAIAG